MRRLVEVAGEADFVADLRIGLDDPGVGSVWQDFAADEGFDAAFLQQRDLLEVAYRAGISISLKAPGIDAESLRIRWMTFLMTCHPATPSARIQERQLWCNHTSLEEDRGPSNNVLHRQQIPA